MPQAAFLSLLQRKLQVSSQRSCEKLIAKQKNSIQHAMEAVDYCSDIFYGGSSSVFANIHCYFDDSAGVRIFDFVSKAGDMISHAIRNFAFECSGMTIDDAFRRLSLLVTMHFAAEIEVFVIVHVIGINHFVHRRMRKSIGNVWSFIVKETFIKFAKKEWILFANSIILTLKLSKLLAMFRTYGTYRAIIVITQIYNMIKEVSITLDDWFKAYDEDIIILPYLFMNNKHSHCYSLKDIVFANMLGESWLKVLILYNEAFVERSTLVLQHIVTIREVVMPFSVEIILINKCFTQVSQQGAQLCFVFKAKLNQTLEAATCNFHMAIELPTCPHLELLECSFL
ncbi:unnamed protein product [Trifolium pratense]|uniref:Uncharacterized protein n=1 Tax=Trifolium pratense TaxID=57577 RepID=A0ACB0IGR3_TRIPR|nr:unnamed protein product [Trifolium pratense]